MGKATRTFRVKLTETNAYYVDIAAKDEDHATEIAEARYWSTGPLPCAGFEVDIDWRGDGIEFTETEELPADTPAPPPPIIPISRTENAYTYSPEHCSRKGWVLAILGPSMGNYPTIQRVDDSTAFANDHEAAFHVICSAALAVGPEGNACRDALRHIIAFGHDGLNPIATMI